MTRAPRLATLAMAAATLSVAVVIVDLPSYASKPASNNGYPQTVHAANGSVVISKRPTAIVSLSPTATEMLYAIGAGHQVKAVDQYSDYPLGAPKTKLDGYQPNVEAIVSYKPDLVVVAGDTTGLTAQLAPFHVPVLSLPSATTVSDEYQQIGELGQATGHASSAKTEVAKIQGQIKGIVQKVPKHKKPLTYYFELEQTYFSVTSATFIGQVLGLLGLKSIADGAAGVASNGGYPQLSAEYIIKTNPNYIFLADTLCCGQTAKTVAARPGWSSLSAVSHGHVVPLSDDIASRWGPRIVDLLRTVNAALAHSNGT
jgi:iron complex transport system substrate-binding protein